MFLYIFTELILKYLRINSVKIFKVIKAQYVNYGSEPYYQHEVQELDKNLPQIYKNWLEKYYPNQLSRYIQLKTTIDNAYKNNELNNIENLEEEYENLSSEIEHKLEEFDESVAVDEDLEPSYENANSLEEDLADVYMRYLNGEIEDDWERISPNDPRILNLIQKDKEHKGISYLPSYNKLKEMGLVKHISKEENLVKILKSVINERGLDNDFKNVSDKDLIDAAKDAYFWLNGIKAKMTSKK